MYSLVLTLRLRFGLSLCARRNTEILALWILTEVDLNRADFSRDTFIELVWSFEQRKSPYQILPGRGINVKHFFNTLSDRLAISDPAFKIPGLNWEKMKLLLFLVFGHGYRDILA
mgnify:CR=1 FL=1